MVRSIPDTHSPAATPGVSLAPPGSAVALVAALVVVIAPALRTLYPILYEIGEDWSYEGVGAIGVLLYASPVLAVLAQRLRPGPAITLGAALCLAALALTAVPVPVPVWAAGAATVCALVGITLVVHRLSGAAVVRVLLLAGLLVGLAADTALRGWLRTWDITWRHDLSTAVIGLGAAACVLAALISVSPRLGDEDVRTSRVSAATSLSVGAFLGLQVLFLQSPAFVGSQSGVPFWVAVGVVLAGDALALGILLALPALRRSRSVLGLLGLGAVAGAAVLPASGGVAPVVLVVGLQVAMTALIGAAVSAERAEPTRVRRIAGPAAAAGASALVVILVFLWQFAIIVTLPFPRWAIPAFAAGLVAGAALGTRSSPAALAPAPARVVGLAGAGVAALAVLMGASLLLTATSRSDPVALEGPVRVMTYNIRSGIDTDGQLRPDAIVAEIRAQEPDVLAVQEVGRGWAIHTGIDVLAYLEQTLGMRYVYRGAADGQFGNAVLTTLPVRAESSGQLPYLGGQERSWVSLEVEVDSARWLVVGTHLENGDPAQVDALLAVAGGARPAVIAGDLNLHPDDPDAGSLSGWTDAVAETGDRCRTTSAEPTKECDRPDWILTTPDVSVLDLVIGSTPASDHLPIVAQLEVPAP